MRCFGQALLAVLALAVLQGLLTILVVAILALLVWGLIFRTKETVGLLAFGLLLELLFVHPAATIASAGALLAALWIGSRVKHAAPHPPLLALPPPTAKPESD